MPPFRYDVSEERMASIIALKRISWLEMLAVIAIVAPCEEIHFSVRFEVFTAVTMNNGIFWDVTLCGSSKNRRFGGTWRLLHQGDKNR
jgi:hypothetical protein